MVHEAASIAQSNDSTPASRMENSLVKEGNNNEGDSNEEDSNEEDSAEDGDTGMPLLEDYAHDSGASAARDRDRTRNTVRTTAIADIQENTQIKEVDTYAEDDDEEDGEEDEDLDETNSRENSASKQQTVPLPKRSQRVKKTTSWITSGDYVVNQQVVTKQPDWKTRADYLQTLVSSDVFTLKIAKN